MVVWNFWLGEVAHFRLPHNLHMQTCSLEPHKEFMCGIAATLLAEIMPCAQDATDLVRRYTNARRTNHATWSVWVLHERRVHWQPPSWVLAIPNWPYRIPVSKHQCILLCTKWFGVLHFMRSTGLSTWAEVKNLMVFLALLATSLDIVISQSSK